MSPMCTFNANCTHNLCHPKEKIQSNDEKDDKSTNKEHITEPVEEEIVDKISDYSSS